MSIILLSLTALAFVDSCGLAIFSRFAAEYLQAETGIHVLDGSQVFKD